MKSVLTKLFKVLIVFMLISNIVKSQDTLILINGTKIASKIFEINSNEIKYKKSNNPDGPVFITNKSDVAIIKYLNGTVDTLALMKPKAVITEKAIVIETPKLYAAHSKYMFGDTRITENQMYRKIKALNDPTLTKYVNKAKVGKGGQYVGLVAIPALAGGVGYTLYTAISGINNGNGPVTAPRDNDYTPSVPFFIIGVACLATSIVFKIQYKHSNAAIVKLYNEKY